MHKIPLNENWTFRKLEGISIDTADAVHIDELCSAGLTEKVSLPHTWYMDEEPYRGLTLYEKAVTADTSWEKLFIDIPAADQQAKVFVDDTLVASHKGGYSAFRGEVPQSSLANGTFQLRIFVSNEVNSEISPLAGDFPVYGGLYRGVNLIAAEQVNFDYLYYGTDGILVRTAVLESDGQNIGLIHCEPHVVAPEGAEIRYTVLHSLSSSDKENGSFREDNKILQSAVYPADRPADILIENPKLWNGRKSAALYIVQAELLWQGKVTDTVRKRTGFRSFRMNPQEGFFLNGQHLRINGVAKHQDRDGFYNAVPDQNLEQDFDLIDEIGANALRLSHYQHPQRAYDLADERGLIVWAEIPMLKLPDKEAVAAGACLQLKELILQNMHHPSIFFWGIQNEIGMFGDEPYMHGILRSMYDLAKHLDPERLVCAANLYTVRAGSGLNAVTDMIGYNVYFGWYYGKMHDYDEFLDRFHDARPQLPLGMSEYGVDANPALHAAAPQIRDYSEEYQALYHETVYPIFCSKPYLWGSFVWNMFDFASPMRNEGGKVNRNQKGLVSFDRRVRKDAFYYYKAQWSKEPFVHICSRRFAKRAETEIDLKIYTNEQGVRLVLNGREFGVRKNTGNGMVLFRNIPLHDAENTVRTISVDHADVQDECVFTRVDEPCGDYVLAGSGAGQNVRNWFLTEDDIVREGYFSIANTASDIMHDAQAAAVLEQYAPELFAILRKGDIIPAGLSLQSILSRDESGIDRKALNKALNQVPDPM